jgi:rubrerythrin
MNTHVTASAAVSGPDKLLSIGAFGETVAAYRYTVLSERAPTEQARRAFAAMADEEQDHKQRLQALLAGLFPQSDFVLTAQDKEQVVSGPRLLDVRDETTYHAALTMILETERKTAGFYAQHARNLTEPTLRALFEELAEEGVEHYQRLRALACDNGVRVD